MWKLPKSAAEAQDAAIRLRHEAVMMYHDMLEDGHDKHAAYLMLIERFARINERMTRPRELSEGDKIL